ncbi:hypothetical protein AVEN_178930-1 [Araneus ventricosus]|uniref:Uncharacterized protein n=1 Tax=Araneus ventricosus TaxID=182803 RepID=A0A4Y2N8G7_ARAVE|nr:hypothetical protein AVEN_178930-1 [Araneus ventricosus]
MGTLSMPIDEAAETPKCSPGTSNTVSPFDISPVPNIKKRTTTRGRKAIRFSLITGSPYKDQLTKSLEKNAPKKTSLSAPGDEFKEEFIELQQAWKVFNKDESGASQSKSSGFEDDSFVWSDPPSEEEEEYDSTPFSEEFFIHSPENHLPFRTN